MNSHMKNLVFGDVSEGHGHEEMHGRVRTVWNTPRTPLQQNQAAPRLQCVRF